MHRDFYWLKVSLKFLKFRKYFGLSFWIDVAIADYASETCESRSPTILGVYASGLFLAALYI